MRGVLRGCPTRSVLTSVPQGPRVTNAAIVVRVGSKKQPQLRMSSIKEGFDRMRKPRVSPKIPTHEIDFLMGCMHVATPDDRIRVEIRRRAKSWPAVLAKQAEEYAMWSMEQNRAIVRQFRV